MQYDFDREFQRCLLAALWADESFIRTHVDVVRPEFFTEELHEGLARTVLDFWKERKKLPDIGAVIEQVKENVAPGRKWGEYADEARRIWKRRGTNTAFYRDRAVDFARKSAVAGAVAEAYEILQTGDIDRISAVMDRAMKTGATAGGFYDFFGGVKDRLKHYTGSANGDTVPRVRTGMGPLDSAIQGGMGPGELGVIVALPKGGKSTMLVSFGVAALMSGSSVLHISLENSRQLVASRYDARFFGRSIEKIRKLPKRFKRSMAELGEKIKSKLEIVFQPSKSLTVSQVEAMMAQADSPGLVIVDYAALLKSSTKREDKRHELTDIFEGLRRVAGQMQIPIWTGHQANRPGMSVRTLGMENLAECFEVGAIVDVGIALCQTDDEQRRGDARVHVFGNRLGKAGFEIACEVEWETAKVRAILEEDD